ncbi:MAG: hypothetical protein AB7W47_06140 [Calditrichaceae bacterium]
MKIYLILLLIIFSAKSLPAQEFMFGLSYPAFSYSRGYENISSEKESVLYGVGISVDIFVNEIHNQLLLKSSFGISSYQNFTNKMADFYNLSFNTFINRLSKNKYYYGIGFGLHDYVELPADFDQASIAGNFGLFVKKSIYVDFIMNYMLMNEEMQNDIISSVTIGYRF